MTCQKLGSVVWETQKYINIIDKAIAVFLWADYHEWLWEQQIYQ